MSRVYFHTKNEDTAELLGRERAHMGLTCSDIAGALIPAPWGDDVEHYFTEKARASLLSTDPRFREKWVGTMLNVGHDRCSI